MIESRRWASAQRPSSETHTPESSGPRCASDPGHRRGEAAHLLGTVVALELEDPGDAAHAAL